MWTKPGIRGWLARLRRRNEVYPLPVEFRIVRQMSTPPTVSAEIQSRVQEIVTRRAQESLYAATVSTSVKASSKHEVNSGTVT